MTHPTPPLAFQHFDYLLRILFHWKIGMKVFWLCFDWNVRDDANNNQVMAQCWKPYPGRSNIYYLTHPTMTNPAQPTQPTSQHPTPPYPSLSYPTMTTHTTHPTSHHPPYPTMTYTIPPHSTLPYPKEYFKKVHITIIVFILHLAQVRVTSIISTPLWCGFHDPPHPTSPLEHFWA